MSELENITESMDDYKEELEASFKQLDDGDIDDGSDESFLAWDALKKAFESGEALELEVQGVVPGGVIVYPEGIRGFIPASQLSLSYVEDLNTWLNKNITAKILELDPSEKKLVLSSKVIAKEKAEEERNHKISMLVPGAVVEGIVDSLMPYGAFIDLGDGLSGLVHISQICEKRIKKPSEVLTIGQKVKAKLLNTDNGKISLSIRALTEEMIDAENDEILADAEKFISKEEVSTSLGSLLSKFKF